MTGSIHMETNTCPLGEFSEAAAHAINPVSISSSLPNSTNLNGGISSSRVVTQLPSTKNKRKLILHFDQHNTIQVACTLPGRSLTVEEGLNNFLTSAVWGKEIDNSEWEWCTNEPQISKPRQEPNAITYFKYLEKQIVKSPDDRAELKKQTCSFVYQEPGCKFREFFDLYLQSLICQPDQGHTSGSTNCETNNNTNHNETSRVKLPCNTIPAGDPENHGSLYHLILPDFFEMILRLQKEKRQFAIVLRTMGIESQNFLDTIKSFFDNRPKRFQDLAPLAVNPNIGHIRRSPNERIELEMDGNIYDTDEAIYDKLSSLEGVNAIRDDFAFWQKNDYECYSAKPLWINLLDKSHHHIIFDDNIRLDAVDDCIVNIRLLNSSVREYESVDFECYNFFNLCSIIQPNLIQLLNPFTKTDSTKSYFYEKIKKAEKIFEFMLDNESQLDIQTKSDCDSSSSGGYSRSKSTASSSDTNEPNSADADSKTNFTENCYLSKSLGVYDAQSFETNVNIDALNLEESVDKNRRQSINKAAMNRKRKAKIRLQRCLSKEEQMEMEREDTIISKTCSIQ